MEVVAEPRPDGRRVRGERNKDAVVRALLSLYDEGEIEPSAARIAEVAGVSERSVFRYFEDKDDLAATAMTLQMDRVQHLYEALDSSGDFDARLDAILTHRIGLFDAVRGVMRASEVLEHRSEVVR
ncbi:MAG: TetR/AcrR family transcriptional regulator, partial [Ilumatobacteraceae bacterium]